MTHNRFKLFSGDPKSDATLAVLRNAIEEFVSTNNVAPKSIGIEYLEGVKKVIITLGYTTEEKGYPVKLNISSLGKVSFESSDFSGLEKAIEKAAASQDNIICHELFIDESNEFFMIFMTKA